MVAMVAVAAERVGEWRALHTDDNQVSLEEAYAVMMVMMVPMPPTLLMLVMEAHVEGMAFWVFVPP